MASVFKLSLILLIVLFGYHYQEVNAVKKGRGRGKGNYQLARPFRKLTFSLIISGQRWCKLQQTLGWRLFREPKYCDTGITVIDPPEEQEQFIDSHVQSFWAEAGRQGIRPDIDNATKETAYNLNTRRFCMHRAVLAARSPVLEKKISDYLAGQRSWSVRHAFITVFDIPPLVFEYILQFIYTYQIDNFDERHIIDLYVAAHMLRLPDLKDSIEDYILNDMKNSIDQIHEIVLWLKWTQRTNNIELTEMLIKMLQKVIRLEGPKNQTKLRDFARIMCEITRDGLVYNLTSIADRTRPVPQPLWTDNRRAEDLNLIK